MLISELTLIRSKLLTPSPAGLLHRPRVCQAIEHGIERKLTIISAPAGYGKTSALVDFAQHSHVPVCWYTADERDRDLGAFIAYLVGAIGERFPDFGDQTRAVLDSSAGDLFRDPTSIVGEMVNEMLDVNTSFIVVVDNYEALEGAFGIRTFVHRLLQVLPPNCHLMLGSRVLPDVPVTRLVAKRQLVGLTARDLRFTPWEIQELLQASHIEVSKTQAETIVTNSEGWITGILLLADTLREEAKATMLNAEKATVETYNYLAGEVLSRQPPDVQRFLHTSAMLREMSPRLCREALRIKNPHALLTEVERRNLFITRFGKGGVAIYRYHNLFRDFLQKQLHQRDPARYTELHQRAAKWFEQENDVEEAVYHYLAAEIYPNATALMERVAMEWFWRGQVETLLRWAESLPEETKSQAPRLLLYQSKALTDRYDYEGARQALSHAEAGLVTRRDTTNLTEVHNQYATLRLFEGRYEDAISEAHTALEMLGQEKIRARAEAQRLIGTAYVKLGRLAEGATQLQDALKLFRQVGSPYDVVNLLQDLTLAFASQGRFDAAAGCLNEALSIGRRLGSSAQLAGVLNNLGALHYVRGEYREALALYEEGLAAARRGGDLRSQANISEGMASIYRDVGAYQRAESLYNAAWKIARESRPGMAIPILAAWADMYRWQGDHARTLDLLGQAYQLAEEKGLDFEARGLLPASEGITLVENGEIEEGLRLLSEAAHFLEQRQAKRELARTRFSLAKAHLLAGNESRAVTELRQAVNLADDIGTDQFAVVEGQHAEALLRLGITKGITACRTITEGIRRLKAFGEEPVPGRDRTDAGGEIGKKKDAVGHLEIHAFGEGRVTRDGHLVSSSAWRTAIVKELFFYILLYGPLERDTIGVVFWPDASTKKMADSFHTTLYRMRRAVGADAVVTEGGRYRLGDVDYWFDAEAFEALTERARLLPPQDWQAENLWRRAVALYRGDFLPEVERVWCVPKREALRETYVEALVGIGRCHEVRRDFEEAIGWYRRALETDELREDIHRRIMHCYAEGDRRPEALAHYHHYREILRQELNVEPSVETKTLYEQIAGKMPS
ncbi:MAG: BTAD domain-containing putative transcriptional regulator [Chloroflexota bacterium]|nr:BTAD domain-containing putative transcriptional regulator [Chloroflexota bacterium]